LPSSSSDDPDPPKSLPMADTRRRVSRLHGVPRRPDTPGARAARWLDNLEPKEAPPFVAARGDGAVTRRVGGAGARRGRIPDTALAEATIPCVGMVKCPDVCGGCSRDGQSRRVELFPRSQSPSQEGDRCIHGLTAERSGYHSLCASRTKHRLIQVRNKFLATSHAASLRARRRLHTSRTATKLREDEAYITARRPMCS